jgi:hypothetical protein
VEGLRRHIPNGKGFLSSPNASCSNSEAASATFGWILVMELSRRKFSVEDLSSRSTPKSTLPVAKIKTDSALERPSYASLFGFQAPKSQWCIYRERTHDPKSLHVSPQELLDKIESS